MGTGASAQAGSANRAASPQPAGKLSGSGSSKKLIPREKTARRLGAGGKLHHNPHVVPIRFVAFSELKKHGQLPRFGTDSKYQHTLTFEGNANLCKHQDQFNPLRTIFVFVTHEWARPEIDKQMVAMRELMALPAELKQAAAHKQRAKWGKMTWSDKLAATTTVTNLEVSPEAVARLAVVRNQMAAYQTKKGTLPAHPDDENRNKFKLIVSAVESLQKGDRSPLPPGTEIALWIDWCCIDQDKLPEREKLNMAKVLEACDIVLTPVIDRDHKAWEYPEAWAASEGLSQESAVASSHGNALKRTSLLVGMEEIRNQHGTISEDDEGAGIGDDGKAGEEGKAKPSASEPPPAPKHFARPLWQYRAAGWASYWSRGWCGTEALLCATAPVKQPRLRAGLVNGALAAALTNERRAHLVYGTKELEEGKPALFLPPHVGSVLAEWAPDEGLMAIKEDVDVLRQLVAQAYTYIGPPPDEGWQKGYNGKGNGFGTYVNPDGSWITGEFKKSQLLGRGKIMEASGEEYDGQLNGQRKFLTEAYGKEYGQAKVMKAKRHGAGRQVCPNGDAYVGTFAENQRHGRGCLRYAYGSMYNGEWKRNEKNGEGKQVEVDGDVYVGQWQDGKKHGDGKMNFAGGEVYVGAWENDVRHGNGLHIYSTGWAYEGQWNQGLRHGDGKFWAVGENAALRFAMLTSPSSLVRDLADDESAGNPPPEEEIVPAQKEKPKPSFKPSLKQGLGESLALSKLLKGEDPDAPKEGASVWDAMASWTTRPAEEVEAEATEEAEDPELVAQRKAEEEAAAKAQKEAKAAEQARKEAEAAAAAAKAKAEAAAAEVARIEAAARDAAEDAEAEEEASMAQFGWYEGEWQDGLRNGQGTLRSVKQDVYEGNFVNDVQNGHGKWTFAGYSHEGEYVGGQRHGPGKLTYNVGGVYETTWERGVARGEGRYVATTGGVYTGQFVREQFHGEGKYVFAQDEEGGGVLEGSWHRGLAAGRGRRFFPDGSFYVGQWVDGKLHGAGVKFLPSGLTYEGEFRNGMRHGRGRERNCAAVAEAIEDGKNATLAMEHIRKAKSLGQAAKAGDAAKSGADAAGAKLGGLFKKSKWKPVGAAFVTGENNDMLDNALSKADGGPPDTRTALFMLLGMGPITHEGEWADDSPLPWRKISYETSFYQSIRKACGLKKWETGKA
tara:strand:+ start:289 stop:3819 length:3531 start_codon:yes stop_codon:yes gene_type:complete